jgi:hypothetical protein
MSMRWMRDERSLVRLIVLLTSPQQHTVIATMKVSHTFLLVSFLCTSAATTAAAAVQVFPNVLSSADVDHYRQEAAARSKAVPPSASSSSSGYHHRQLVSTTVTLKEHVHDMVRTALLTGSHSSSKNDNEQEEGSTYWVKKLMLDTQAQVTTLTSSTLKSNVDYYQVRNFVYGCLMEESVQVQSSDFFQHHLCFC